MLKDLRRHIMMQEQRPQGAKYISAIDGAYIDLNGSASGSPVDIYFRINGNKNIFGTDSDKYIFRHISANNTDLTILCGVDYGIGLYRQQAGRAYLISPVSLNPQFTFNDKLVLTKENIISGSYWCRLECNEIPYPANYRTYPWFNCTFRALHGCDINVRLERIVAWTHEQTQILYDWVAEQQNGEWGLYDLVNDVFCGNSAGIGEIVGGYEPN